MKDATTTPAPTSAVARARETRERVQALRAAIARFDEIDLHGILSNLHGMRAYARKG